MSDLSLLPVEEPHPSQVPGGFETEITRELEDGTIISFEFAPAGYLSKKGEPRLQDWRAYWYEQPGEKRVRLPSATTLLGAILPKDLTRWGEMHGILGCFEAIKRGELDPAEHTEEDAVERVRALRLGADAARDRAATRGIDVHSVLEDYARTSHLPNVSDFPEDQRGYVRGLLNWLAEYDPEPVGVELLVAHPEYGYAGRLDLKARVRSQHLPTRALRVCDLKTAAQGNLYASAHAQTAMYREADVRCGGEESDTPLLVVVDEHGGFDVMDGLCELDGLLAALTWYRNVTPIEGACQERNRRRRNGRRAA